mgnify:CR=1 FL=1
MLLFVLSFLNIVLTATVVLSQHGAKVHSTAMPDGRPPHWTGLTSQAGAEPWACGAASLRSYSTSSLTPSCDCIISVEPSWEAVHHFQLKPTAEDEHATLAEVMHYC